MMLLEKISRAILLKIKYYDIKVCGVDAFTFTADNISTNFITLNEFHNPSSYRARDSKYKKGSTSPNLV